MFSEFEISLMGKQKCSEITSRYWIPFFQTLVLLALCYLFLHFKQLRKALGIVEDGF